MTLEGALAGGGLVTRRWREEGRDLLRQRNSLREDAVQNLGPQTRGLELSDHLAVGSRTFLLEDADVLHRDDVLLPPDHLRDLNHLARTVAQTVELHEEVDRARDLLPDRAHRQVDA